MLITAHRWLDHLLLYFFDSQVSAAQFLYEVVAGETAEVRFNPIYEYLNIYVYMYIYIYTRTYIEIALSLSTCLSIGLSQVNPLQYLPTTLNKMKPRPPRLRVNP